MTRFLTWFCCGALVGGVGGCSKKEAVPVARTGVVIEVSVTAPSGKPTPVAGVSVKVVSERSLAEALVGLAANAQLTDEIPAPVCAQLFQSIAALPSYQNLVTTTEGTIVLPSLSATDFVMAYREPYFWLESTGQVKDGRLRLGDHNHGGKYALAGLLAQPNVRQMLIATVRQATANQQYEPARAVARIIKAEDLLKEIGAAETAELLKQADGALDQKKYDIVRQVVARLEALNVGADVVQALRQRLLEEEGGVARTFTGHEGPVLSIAGNPLGTMLLSAGMDRTLRLWEVATGKLIEKSSGHRGPVTSVAINAAGDLALSGSYDGSIRLWQMPTFRQLAATESLGWKVMSVALGPKGNLCASGGEDMKVRIWSRPGLRWERAGSGHGWKLNFVCFSPGSNQLLSGSDDDSMKLWDVATGATIRTIRHGTKDITCGAFSPDGLLMISGSADKTIKVWRTDTGEEVQSLSGHEKTVRSVAVSPDGRYILSGSDDQTIKLWELATGTAVHTFTGHSASVTCVVFMPGDQFVASASHDATIKLWQLPRAFWP